MLQWQKLSQSVIVMAIQNSFFERVHTMLKEKGTNIIYAVDLMMLMQLATELRMPPAVVGSRVLLF
jgi:hypothetical protein